MKKILPLLCLALVLTPSLTFAQQGDKPKQPETELGENMSGMNKDWRALRRQAADPAKNANSLELLARIQAAAKKSLDYTPDLAKDIPADKRDAFVAGYQKQIRKAIAGFAQLETLFKAGDNPAAVEQIANIVTIQKEGHKEYKRPE